MKKKSLLLIVLAGIIVLENGCITDGDLAVGSKNRIHTVWIVFEADTTKKKDYKSYIHYQRGLKGGMVWDSVIQIKIWNSLNQLVPVNEVEIEAWENGVGMVIGTFQELYYFHSLDGGKSWEERGVIFRLPDTLKRIYKTQLKATKEGNLHIVMEIYDSLSPEYFSFYYLSSKDGGRNWEEASVIGKGKTKIIKQQIQMLIVNIFLSLSSLAVEGEEVFLAYVDYERDTLGTLNYIFSQDNGLTWIAPQSLSISSSLRFPFNLSPIAGITEERIYFLWNKTISSGPDSGKFESYLLVSPDRGKSWTEAIFVVDKKVEAMEVKKVKDKEVIAILWREAPIEYLPPTRLHLQYSLNGGTSWSSPIFIGDVKGENDFHLAISSYGIHVIYWKAEGKKYKFVEIKELKEKQKRKEKIIEKEWMISPTVFREDVCINYYLKELQNVVITVYNVYGVKVRELLNKTLKCGKYTIKWDGRDDLGKKVSKGVYFIQFKSQKKKKVTKIIKL